MISKDVPQSEGVLLREVAHSLAASEDIRTVMRRVVEGAMAAVQADGGYVERIEERRNRVEIVATLGERGPPLGVMMPYPGSLAEEVIEQKEPELVDNVALERRPIGGILAEACGECAALVMPLISEDAALGALILLRRPGGADFTESEVESLRILSDLAALALRRALLLEESERRRQALEASEGRFRLLVDAVRDYAIFMLDPDGVVTSWNEGAERIKGYRAAEIVGSHFSRFYTPADRERGHPAEVLAIARRTGQYREEGWRVRKDGEPFWASVVLSAVRAEGGELLGFAKVTRDLTERRAAEESLRLQSSLLRAQNESLADAVVVVSPEGKILSHNRRFIELWGFPEALIRSGSDREALEWAAEQTADPAGFVARVEALYADAGAQSRDEVRLRDGRTLDRFGGPVRDADGTQYGYLWFFRDITAARRTEDVHRLLAEAGHLLGASLDYGHTLRAVADLVVPRLADWCVIDVVEGSEICRVAVAHAQEERAALAEEYQRRYPPDPDAPVGAPRVIRTGEAVLYPEIGDEVLRAISRDEEQFRILDELGFRSAMIVPLRAEDRVIGALSLISCGGGRRYTEHDLELATLIAERAALSVTNARHYREAQQATQIRDEVLSIVSHDLRNPLSTIMMSAAFLLETAPQDDRRSSGRQLEIIRRQADQMNRLIQDLLDVARMEAGRLSVETAVIDTRAVLLETVEGFGVLAADRELELELDADEALPAILADRERIVQLLGNLVGNALKFTRARGRIVVGAEAREGEVEFRVVDSGIGIPPEDLPHLFERFYQARNTRRGGAGLGLAISKGIVEAHGGTITVESEVEVGTTFRFTIPVAPLSEAPESVEPPSERR